MCVPKKFRRVPGLFELEEVITAYVYGLCAVYSAYRKDCAVRRKPYTSGAYFQLCGTMFGLQAAKIEIFVAYDRAGASRGAHGEAGIEEMIVTGTIA